MTPRRLSTARTDTTYNIGTLAGVTPGGSDVRIHVMPASIDRSTEIHPTMRQRINELAAEMDSLVGTAASASVCCGPRSTSTFSLTMFAAASARRAAADGPAGAADGAV